MGFWGSSLYANDTTSDVRDSYMNYLMNQLSDQEAYEKILNEYADCFKDEDEGPLAWYALAETQWKVGRLLPEVKEKALYWIEHNGGLELWLDTPSKGKGWLKTLDKLREKLNSPMPKRKNVRRPEPVNNNLWEINDIYAYQFHEKWSEECGLSGKYIAIQKIGEGIPWFEHDMYMRIQVFDKVFDEIPTLEELKGVRLLPIDDPKRTNYAKEPIQMSAYSGVYKKSWYPKKYLTYLGNCKIIENTVACEQRMGWAIVERSVIRDHLQWQGIEYETIGEGVYHYLPKKKDDNT